jgi:hypothetical protein
VQDSKYGAAFADQTKGASKSFMQPAVFDANRNQKLLPFCSDAEQVLKQVE